MYIHAYQIYCKVFKIKNAYIGKNVDISYQSLLLTRINFNPIPSMDK